MLPWTYRFVVENKTGLTTNDFFQQKVYMRRWKFDDSGLLLYEDPGYTALDTGSSTIDPGGFFYGPEIDNLSGKWIGADVLFMAQMGAGSPAGDMVLWMETRVPIGVAPSWPTEQRRLVAVARFSGVASKKIATQI